MGLRIVYNISFWSIKVHFNKFKMFFKYCQFDILLNYYWFPLCNIWIAFYSNSEQFFFKIIVQSHIIIDFMLSKIEWLLCCKVHRRTDCVFIILMLETQLLWKKKCLMRVHICHSILCFDHSIARIFNLKLWIRKIFVSKTALQDKKYCDTDIRSLHLKK